MAQRSHVPKFGNWDGDNVPYTVYFENARKEKSNGMLINPNDPEQNPEAFNFGRPIDPAPMRVSPEKPAAADKYAQEKSSYRHKTHNRVASESSSDKSSSSSSLGPVPKLNHQRRRSDRNNIPPSTGHHKLNSDEFSSRSVSVPKFGEWDEKDPRSAEGFTVIFNKVKEEKHIAASKFPPVPPPTTDNYQTSQKKKTRSKNCCGLF